MLFVVLQLTFGVVVYELPPDAPHAAQPGPELDPRAVVHTQLEALAHNDRPHLDAGVEVAARFAAPTLLDELGGPSGLRAALHGPQLRPLLQHEDALVEAQPGTERSSSVLVITRDRGGRPAGFLFELTRERAGPQPGCWLIARIRRLDGPRPRPEVELVPRLQI